MIKLGQVTAYNDQTEMATITYMRPEACKQCGACGAASQQGSIILKARCHVGNWVCVEFSDKRFLQAAATAYLLPLCTFLLGLALGYFTSDKTDMGTLIGGLAGLVGGFLLLWLNERRIAGRAEWKPRVTQVYTEPPSADMIGCGGES